MIAVRKLSIKPRFGLPKWTNYKTGDAKGSNAVPCPGCGHPLSVVLDGRPSYSRFRRRRCCTNCKLRYTTYEQVAPEFVTDYQI